MFKLRPLSQVFLVNRELINQLVRFSGVSSSDTVLEIGPGQGIITYSLLQTCSRVIAVEIDPQLCAQLGKKYKGNFLLSLHNQNFLDFPLPTQSYKVFSNIPYNITGEIIKKLYFSANPPQDCFLVLQSEAAAKFMVHPNQNTLMSLLLYPYFQLEVVHKFVRSDFRPTPQVDSLLLHISPRPTPLVSPKLQAHYRDYLTYQFVHNHLAKHVSAPQWITLFQNHLSHPFNLNVAGSFSTLQSRQNQLQKIHRTRTDYKWKKYGK